MSGNVYGNRGKHDKMVGSQVPYRVGNGGSARPPPPAASSFTGSPDGNILALDAKTGEVLWRFPDRLLARGTPGVYELTGDQ